MSNAKLEKKLCLAKESPDHVFDLSDCNLKRIPEICTTIKVLRKECLCLRNNQLSDLRSVKNFKDLCLLKILDLSFNNLVELTSEIKYLENLQVLRLNNNCLTCLPNELSALLNLEQLIVSSNKLKSLPESICSLRKLCILDVRKNNLRNLPSCIYQNRMLQSLLIDENDNWENIPKSVIVRGTAEILFYLAKKNGAIDFEAGSVQNEDPSAVADSDTRIDAYDEMIRINLQKREKEKERIILQRIDSEKNILDQQEREFMTHQRIQNEKQEFIVGIIAQQQKIDEKVELYQKLREQEQNKFIQKLKYEENTSDNVIRQLLETNAEQKKHSVNSLITSMNEEIFSKDAVSSEQVLESMEKLLLEEYEISKTLEEKECDRRSFMNNVCTAEEEELQSKVHSILSLQHDQRKSLVESIKSNTDLQHAALLMLMEKSDSRNIELHNQIALLQQQLFKLTNLELQNRRLNMKTQINELAERRIVLSELLLDIFEQQRAYHKKMVEELNELANQRERENADNYWLMQYHRLLNLQPDATKSVNPSLLYELVLYGVSHYAPVLAFCKGNLNSIDDYSRITDSDLKRVGINDTRDRCVILKAINNFVCQSGKHEVAPSAPELSESVNHSPSAPPAEETRFHRSISLDSELSNECVICLDEQSRVVFFPCGHLCSCIHCSVPLSQCPLCRCDISQKMQIFTH